MYRTTGAQYKETPRWFDEGLATRVQMTPDGSYETILQQAIASQATIPFSELCADFPPSEDEVRLAYAQSEALVAYIQQEYGVQALRDLVLAYADGVGCEGGVSRVLGTSMAALERAWLEYEKPAPPLVKFMRNNGLWLALAGGGFLIMGLLLIPFRRER